MPIKQYNPTSQQWEDYNEELVNESVGRCYIRGKYRVAWRGLHAHNGVRFTRWTSTNSLPTTAGNYVLMNDVTLSSTWTVPTGTTNLCLNGNVIKITSNASAITVSSGRTLNIYDINTKSTRYVYWSGVSPILTSTTPSSTYRTLICGVITGNTNQKIDGGGLYINGGTVNMYGGNIAACCGANGGAVAIRNGGTFNLYGGCVDTNYGNDSIGGSSWQFAHGAGGVHIIDGTFNMYGGKVSNNKSAQTAGGICAGTSAIINIYNGEISYNIAGLYSGGGLWLGQNNGQNVNPPLINIYGGKIINNASQTLGGGISITRYCTANFFGGEITQNTSNTDKLGKGLSDDATVTINIGKDFKIHNNGNSNAYLVSKLHIIEKLETVDIGITLDNPGTFTSGYSTYNTETPDTFFSSDNANYEVTLASGEAKLVSV